MRMFKITFSKDEMDEYLGGIGVGIVKCQNPECTSGIQSVSKMGGKYLCPPCWYRQKHAGHNVGTEKPFLDHMEFLICKQCWGET